MIDPSQLALFIPVALALNLTPGSDMMFCMAQSMKGGSKAGLAATAGIATGSFLHSLAAGLGLAAVVATNPLVFEIIRWAGVLYLIYLAYKCFRDHGANLNTQPDSGAVRSLFAIYRGGCFVNLLNPKVGLFILALVPQFIDPLAGSVFLQFMIFGLILNIGGSVICAIVSFSSGRLADYLKRRPLVSRIMNMFSGAVFVGLAAKLSIASR